MIASGRRRWMMAGGTDSMINPLGVAGFCSIGATSTANDDPPRASRPFDRETRRLRARRGRRHADSRAARGRAGAAARRVQAEICGYGTSFDAHGISEPHPEGRGAFQAMSRALHEARIDAADIDCINAHGTATPKNDPGGDARHQAAARRARVRRAGLRHEVDDRASHRRGRRGGGDRRYRRLARVGGASDDQPRPSPIRRATSTTSRTPRASIRSARCCRTRSPSAGQNASIVLRRAS